MTICRRSKQDGTYILFYFFWSISNSTFRRQCVQIHVIQIAYFKTIFQNKDYSMTKCINSIIAVLHQFCAKIYIHLRRYAFIFISMILLHTSITRRSCSSRMNLLFCCIEVHTSIYISLSPLQ